MITFELDKGSRSNYSIGKASLLLPNFLESAFLQPFLNRRIGSKLRIWSQCSMQSYGLRKKEHDDGDKEEEERVVSKGQRGPLLAS